MKKKGLLTIISLFVLTLILAACGGNDDEAKQDGTDEGSKDNVENTVEIGMLKLTSTAPLFIALEKGFFEEEGIDAKEVWFDAAQPIAVATTSGDVDVGATGITASLYNMVAGGEELFIVADKGREQKGYSSTAFLVPNDSDVEEIAQLEGKRIGITQTGSTYHYMAGQVLEKHGVALQDVELVPLNSIQGLMESLESKQVDAVLLNEPNISVAVEEGYGKVITQIGDEIDYQTSGIFFSKNFADNEEVAQRFLKAYIRATNYYYDAVLVKEGDEIEPGENYDEVIDIIAKYTDQEPDLIKKGLPYMDRDGKLLDSDIQTQVDWYAKENLIDEAIDAGKIVNTELLEEALKSLE